MDTDCSFEDSLGGVHSAVSDPTINCLGVEE